MGKTFTDPRALAADMHAFVARAAGQVMTSVTNAVVEATPVDTTHAKTNWVPSVGAPHDGVVGSKENPDAGPQSSGYAALATYDLKQGDLFTTNDVDYMEHLDQGSSAQAPPDFVNDAVDVGIRTSGHVPGGE